MPSSEDFEALSRKAALYQQLTLLHPEDTSYPRRYAELLLQLGQDIKARMVLEKLRARLVELNRFDDADKLGQLQTLVRLAHEKQPKHAFSPLLNHIGNNKHALFRSRPERVVLNEGSYLIHRGETDENVYVLLEGELSVWIPNKNSHEGILIDILKQGQTVGEAAILDGMPRNADILAIRRCILMKFNPRMITHLLLNHPDTETSLRNEHVIRKHMLVLSTMPLFETMPATLRRTLAERAQIKNYDSYQLIAEIGKPIQEVGILVSGQARRIANDKLGNSHLFAALNPGQLIANEAALPNGSILGSDTFMTSIIAIEESSVLCIPIDAFRQTLEIYPPLLAAMLRDASSALSGTINALNKINRSPPEKHPDSAGWNSTDKIMNGNHPIDK